jgi:hypothetical protein
MAMVKRFLAVLSIFLLFASSVVTYADVVWINEFYHEHRQENKTLSRKRFCANGPEGYIYFKEAPGSDVDAYDEMPYKNGSEFTLDGIYTHKGKYWGGNSDNGHYSTLRT